jgi:hypothetical protein
VRKLEVKRSLGQSSSRLNDNIKMDLKGIESEDVEWIELVLSRDQWIGFVGTPMNLAFHNR